MSFDDFEQIVKVTKTVYEYILVDIYINVVQCYNILTLVYLGGICLMGDTTQKFGTR